MQINSVNRVMPPRRKPMRQSGRQRHVYEKFHSAISTVSSSASRAAYSKASSMSSRSR